jgi:DNA-binding XRE family transcriptional regulator
MKAEELTEWRRIQGFTQAGLAQALVVDVGTINRWEKGKMQIPPYLPLALKGIEAEGGGQIDGMVKRKRTRKEAKNGDGA